MSNEALSDKERQILAHTLTGGLDTKVYRNFFAAGLDTEDWKTCLELVQKGLMYRYANSKVLKNVIYFHATEEGAAAAGLSLKG